jgi:hypothetical protein
LQAIGEAVKDLASLSSGDEKHEKVRFLPSLYNNQVESTTTYTYHSSVRPSHHLASSFDLN